MGNSPVWVTRPWGTLANALLRRPKPKGWIPLEELEEDIEDFIKAYLNAT